MIREPRTAQLSQHEKASNTAARKNDTPTHSASLTHSQKIYSASSHRTSLAESQQSPKSTSTLSNTQASDRAAHPEQSPSSFIRGSEHEPSHVSAFSRMNQYHAASDTSSREHPMKLPPQTAARPSDRPLQENFHIVQKQPMTSSSDTLASQRTNTSTQDSSRPLQHESTPSTRLSDRSSLGKVCTLHRTGPIGALL